MVLFHRFYTEEKWARVNSDNKVIVEDYIKECTIRKRKSSTIMQYNNDLRIFLIWVLEERNNVNILTLTKKDFRDLLLWLIEEQEVSSARVNRILSSCKNLFAYIEDCQDYEGYISQIAKIKSVPKEKVREIVFLSDETIRKLLELLDKKQKYREAALIALAYDTGARKSELAQIQKYSFLNESDSVTNKIIGKRGKKYRAVYHSQAKKYVRKYLQYRGEDNIPELFITDRMTPASPQILYLWVKNVRKELEEILGYEVRLNVHSLRHSFINNCINGTIYFCRELGIDSIPVELVRFLVNHQNADITKSYCKDTSLESVESLFGIKFEPT